MITVEEDDEEEEDDCEEVLTPIGLDPMGMEVGDGDAIDTMGLDPMGRKDAMGLNPMGLGEGDGVGMLGIFIADARNLSKLTEPNLFVVVELLYLAK